MVVREMVPPGTEYLAAESSNWSCPDGSTAGTVCLLNIGNFAAGASGEATFAVTVVVNETETQLERIVNVVETNDDGSNGSDPTPSNNVDVAILEIFTRAVSIPVMPRLFLLSLLLATIGIAAHFLRNRRSTRQLQ